MSKSSTAVSTKTLLVNEQEKLLEVLRERFTRNPSRHKGMEWEKVEKKLQKNPQKLEVLFVMEQTGGEPDVVTFAQKGGEYIFMDCSVESPSGRRSLCYDRVARESRKEHAPKMSVLEMAATIEIELLTEGEYRELQKFGMFDLKTSSWVQTPVSIRKLGGALFCDRRYDTVFTYHNGAESYYAARGFRGLLRV